MVVFGDEAFTQCPLTLDTASSHFLDRLEVGMAGDRNRHRLGARARGAAPREVEGQVEDRRPPDDGRNNAGR